MAQWDDARGNLGYDMDMREMQDSVTRLGAIGEWSCEMVNSGETRWKPIERLALRALASSRSEEFETTVLGHK